MPVRLRPRRSPAATSRRPPMRLRFLGCGDAFGSGGRFNTCFLASGAGTSFLIDCGASSLVAMRRFGVDPNDIHAVFVSHLPADPFGRPPFLHPDPQFALPRPPPPPLPP